MPAITSLFGREHEMQVLGDLLKNVDDHGGSLVVTGAAGIGKSALLAETITRAGERGMLVLTVTGVQSEAQLPFAGLHQLLRPLLGEMIGLSPPQHGAMLAAFGLTDETAPDLFLTALGTLNLIAARAAATPILIVAEDAHWLDRSTSDVLAFVARRLDFDPIVLVASVNDSFRSPLNESGLPSLHVGELSAPAAGALLDSRAPGLTADVRKRLLAEAAGNPLALVELPKALLRLDAQTRLPAWLPITTRLERAFAARVSDLPAATRTALLVAALDDGSRVAEVIDATAVLTGAGPTLDVLDPAVAAALVDLDDAHYQFRHPLIRTAIYHEASVSQRHAAHAALAEVLADQPLRAVWHRAASITGPDEQVANDLEEAAVRAQRRGATVLAISALKRSAALSYAPLRAGRLLRAAELGFERGEQGIVLGLLEETELLDLQPLERARMAWIRESFADGIPGDASKVRSLAVIAADASGRRRPRPRAQASLWRRLAVLVG